MHVGQRLPAAPDFFAIAYSIMSNPLSWRAKAGRSLESGCVCPWIEGFFAARRRGRNVLLFLRI